MVQHVKLPEARDPQILGPSRSIKSICALIKDELFNVPRDVSFLVVTAKGVPPRSFSY